MERSRAEVEREDARYARERERMVEEQLGSRGVTDARVLAAMRRVPRHRFVQEALQARAYGDHPLPIGEEQTISQPFIVALMTSLLELTGREKVLEVGTGSGYQTAVLAELARRVCSIERLPRLAERARALLESLGYRQRLGPRRQRSARVARPGAVRPHHRHRGRAVDARRRSCSSSPRAAAWCCRWAAPENQVADRRRQRRRRDPPGRRTASASS